MHAGAVSITAKQLYALWHNMSGAGCRLPRSTFPAATVSAAAPTLYAAVTVTACTAASRWEP